MTTILSTNLCRLQFYLLTFVEPIFKCTSIGASVVLAICAGWLMVSQSKTTICSSRANSNILSTSACTSAKTHNLYLELK